MTELYNKITARMEELRSNMPEVEDSFTRDELVAAIRKLNNATHGPLAFGEYWNAEGFANSLLAAKNALAERKHGWSDKVSNKPFTPKQFSGKNISYEELWFALKNAGYGVGLTDRLFDNALKERELKEREPVSKPISTATYAELEAALKVHGHKIETAQALFSTVAANREPVWQYRDIVKSKSGNTFIRQDPTRKPATQAWLEVATDREVSFDTPARPLKLIGRELITQGGITA